MVRVVLISLLSCLALRADAITQITSFWEMNVTDADRIAYDSKGSAHGEYFGTAFNADTSIFGGGWHRGAGTQLPFNSGGLSMPGATVATGTSSFAYCNWSRRSSTNGDIIMGHAWSSDVTTRSWFVNFNATPGYPVVTYGKTDGNAATVADTGVSVTTGDLAMICMRYNSADGKVGVSVNGRNWVEASPTAPFQVPSGNVCSLPSALYDPFYPCTLDFSHARNQFFPTGEPVIGRTMFWNGYLPTNGEVAAIYNGGSGRDATYFGLTYTPPTRPLTVSLVDASFADDTLLSDQGLYYLRPYPLKFWSPALAVTNGDYVWLRSTDHQQVHQHFYIGYSASPTTLPASWTEVNPPHNALRFDGFETPSLVWNSDTSLFHLYAHGDDLLTSAPFEQVTMMWTSPDLVTWTAGGGDAFPPNTAACPLAPCYNHTGYATVARNGTGDWAAQTLLESSEPSGTDGFIRLGLWSSTDGKNFTFVRETETMVPRMPYRNNQNQHIGVHVPLSVSGVVISANYVGYAASSQFEFSNPAWLLFEHPGDNSPAGDYLQDTRAYEEAGTVYLYAKWSFREPSTVRLYTGTLASQGPRSSTISGRPTISGKVTIQ